MNIELISVLLQAVGLGMLHALDADHVMAVSGLSCRSAAGSSSLAYCARWALGHGAILLLLGLAVIVLGMSVPHGFSNYAEGAVGVMLVTIGLVVMHELYRQRVHVHVHQHDGLPEHTHWHNHRDASPGHHGVHQHRQLPVFAGLLHGAAGTAPLLALLPMSQLDSPWAGMLYLVLFCAGVFAAMLMFGGLLGRVFTSLQERGAGSVTVLRILISVLSIAIGFVLVMDVW